jgi:hypothetical protein
MYRHSIVANAWTGAMTECDYSTVPLSESAKTTLRGIGAMQSSPSAVGTAHDDWPLGNG